MRALERYQMSPVITKVVGVIPALTWLVKQPIECQARLGNAFLTLVLVSDIDDHLQIRGIWIRRRMESVQVTILPAERGLDHLMQHIQGEIGSQLQSAPNRRDDAQNLDPHPEGARWLDRVF